MKKPKNKKKRLTRSERAKLNAPYKSGYEKIVALWMEQEKIPFEYEPCKLMYPLPAKGKCAECGAAALLRFKDYLPDFEISPYGKLNPKDRFFLETKGRLTSVDRTKMLAVIKEYPTVKFRMLFMRDEPLNKGKKAKYSDWCKRKGIEYAVGTELPKEWYKPKAKVVQLRRTKLV